MIEIKNILGEIIWRNESLTYFSETNLSGANLFEANLSGANLSGANLSGADLSGADLSGADLSGADLTGANLFGANLTRANLFGANLTRANLSGANLTGANLSDTELQTLVNSRTIVADGHLTVWKKLADGSICKLRIPESARRLGGLLGRKCRAEWAVVLEGKGVAIHDRSFCYSPGLTVLPSGFDPDPRKECSEGIHFFISRQEAESYPV